MSDSETLKLEAVRQRSRDTTDENGKARRGAAYADIMGRAFEDRAYLLRLLDAEREAHAEMRRLMEAHDTNDLQIRARIQASALAWEAKASALRTERDKLRAVWDEARGYLLNTSYYDDFVDRVDALLGKEAR